MPQLVSAHRRMFFAWGCVIAVLVLLSIPFSPEKRPSPISPLQWGEWAGAFASFLLAFSVGSMVWQSASVVALVMTRPALGLEGALFVIVAFQLGTYARPRIALGWIAMQSIALFAILELRGFGVEHSLSVFAAYFPFQLLAFYTSRVLARESESRNTLARVNRELLATRELLAETSRASERLRISRELHDVFGHRLAALTVNLEVATHAADAEKPKFIARAHDSATAMLRDVRDVVANLRRDAPPDLRELLRSVVSDIPRPAIHLDWPPSLPSIDRDSAQLLLRCAQEIVTNAIKHSAGENLWMRLQVRDGGIEMIARDDGRGAPQLREGAGLRGMRERLESAGGSMLIDTKSGDGFRVHVTLPGAAS